MSQHFHLLSSFVVSYDDRMWWSGFWKSFFRISDPRGFYFQFFFLFWSCVINETCKSDFERTCIYLLTYRPIVFHRRPSLLCYILHFWTTNNDACRHWNKIQQVRVYVYRLYPQKVLPVYGDLVIRMVVNFDTVDILDFDFFVQFRMKGLYRACENWCFQIVTKQRSCLQCTFLISWWY